MFVTKQGWQHPQVAKLSYEKLRTAKQSNGNGVYNKQADIVSHGTQCSYES